MDWFFTYENRLSFSNETIKINMNDVIMEEQYELLWKLKEAKIKRRKLKS
jgi:hypothetical protein